MPSDQPKPGAYRVISREPERLSPWVTLEKISVTRNGPGAVDVYHAFRQADYVQVMAMTREAKFILVEQYRPVVEQSTIELPGGLREDGESPETTALRELTEETGFAASELVPLIECYADVGLWVIGSSGFLRSPSQWPSRKQASSCYLQTAVSCRTTLRLDNFRLPGRSRCYI